MRQIYIPKCILLISFFVSISYQLLAQTMETINVTEDTYVYGSSSAEGNNYGSDQEIYARDTTTSAPRITYLKFPVNNSIGSVTNATLEFYARVNSSSSGTETLEIHKLTSSWNENTVTWLTKPNTGAKIGTKNITVGPTNPAPYSKYSFDVTDYFNEVLGGSGTEISFALKALPADIGGNSSYVRFGTRETVSESIGASVAIEYVLGVDDFRKNNNSLKIYPNPVNERFTLINTFSSSGEMEITFLDLLGKEVSRISENYFAGKWEKSYRTSELNLKNGIYIVMFSSDQFGNSYKKIIVN